MSGKVSARVLIRTFDYRLVRLVVSLIDQYIPGQSHTAEIDEVIHAGCPLHSRLWSILRFGSWRNVAS
jgi:hypothetical protein